MKNFTNSLIGFLTLLMSFNALAQDVMVNADADGNITVDWISPPCVEPNDGWEDEFLVDQPFEIKYKKVPSASWETPVYSDGTTVFFPADLFESGELYKFRVKYYGRDADCGGFRRVRFLGTEDFTYNVVVFEEAVFDQDIQVIPGLTKKIHGVAFDKCLYPYTWDGGSIDSVRTHHWGCFSEPPKAFLINVLGSGQMKLHSQTLGLCLQPKGLSSGDDIGVGSCDSIWTIFNHIPIDGDIFKLQNVISGKCMTATAPVDGALASQNECNNNDDRQNFFFEDY